MFKRYKFRNYDFILVILIWTISAVGIMAVGSAEESLQTKQLMGVIMGTVMMIVISLLDYTMLIKLYVLMYVGNVGLLLLVKFVGDDAGGAQRWLDLGFFKFQPSETAKILLILFFAQFIMKYKEKFNTIRVIGACLVLVFIPWILVLTQPDLSTSIVIIAVFCIIMFAGGISFKWILTALAIVIPAVAILLTVAMQPGNGILEQYQKNRILAFINPQEYASEEAYQQLNSVTAIASGMLEGKGYDNNEITSVINGNFVSEPQTDFIFAVIGEELGFRGGFLVIFLLFAIAIRCVNIARKAKDVAGCIIAAGMGGLVAFQSFFNIGVAMFIMPNTGLPLPFVSYGLTSVMSLYIGMGFVLNVRLQGKR